MASKAKDPVQRYIENFDDASNFLKDVMEAIGVTQEEINTFKKEKELGLWKPEQE